MQARPCQRGQRHPRRNTGDKACAAIALDRVWASAMRAATVLRRRWHEFGTSRTGFRILYNEQHRKSFAMEHCRIDNDSSARTGDSAMLFRWSSSHSKCEPSIRTTLRNCTIAAAAIVHQNKSSRATRSSWKLCNDRKVTIESSQRTRTIQGWKLSANCTQLNANPDGQIGHHN